jgi:DNA repair protein RadC
MRNTFRWREEAWAPPKRNHNRMVVKGNYGISRAVIFLDQRHRLISYQEMFQGIFSVAPAHSRVLRSAGDGELEA